MSNNSLKSYKSALCIIPPKSQWPNIQLIRQKHDKHYKRWMPHINLIYPFILPQLHTSDNSNSLDNETDSEIIDDNSILQILKKSLYPIHPFKLKLQNLNYFTHGKQSSTVWLHPETVPKNALIESENRLIGRSNLNDCENNVKVDEKDDENFGFPGFDDLLKIGNDGFKPHLSLGQFRGEKSSQEAIEKFSLIFSQDPIIEFEVTEICWIVRKGFHDPFEIKAKVGLGIDGEIVINE
ncbi:RNA ligase/cyclic nucleotide phosphodiesterase [Gigaspora margarita]|uniref:RNA ligase/cyclic nucleotide phosphodiesterase n=1 Tax=Gigaspora margarita TaxID=4874 RepID=A0A8H3WTU5_GIGMA|nr:RNA ligase/cyclic nucleotide phosphodiesterase [Gigaspora margarita]